MPIDSRRAGVLGSALSRGRDAVAARRSRRPRRSGSARRRRRAVDCSCRAAGGRARRSSFAAAGWDVLAVDFSSEAVALARRHLAGSAVEVREADVFELDEPPFDLVYERAFLCALHPHTRAAYGRRMPELVAPGGVLAGYFDIGERARRPAVRDHPRGSRRAAAPAFTLETDEPSIAPMPASRTSAGWSGAGRQRSSSYRSSTRRMNLLRPSCRRALGSDPNWAVSGV